MSEEPTSEDQDALRLRLQEKLKQWLEQELKRLPVPASFVDSDGQILFDSGVPEQFVTCLRCMVPVYLRFNGGNERELLAGFRHMAGRLPIVVGKIQAEFGREQFRESGIVDPQICLRGPVRERS